MKRDDLQRLSLMRLREARALLWSGNYPGAYYLAGYAVECALKACLARQTEQYEFPDKKRANEAWEHLLTKLVIPAGLKEELDEKLKTDVTFKKNWTTVVVWSVESRYTTEAVRGDVEDLIQAIENPQGGILQWLQQHW